MNFFFLFLAIVALRVPPLLHLLRSGSVARIVATRHTQVS